MDAVARVAATLQVPDDPSVTAVTMRGLNRQVTREGLLMLLYHASQHLERPKYDFVYLPWAMRKACNIGLAFINFEDHASCMEFFDALQRSPELLMGFDVRYIGPATLQGRGPNLEDTVAKRGTGILYSADAPLVFNRGEQCDLLEVVAHELPHLWAQLEVIRARRQRHRYQGGYMGPRPRGTFNMPSSSGQMAQEVIPGASAARAEYMERLMANPHSAALLSFRGGGSEVPTTAAAQGSSSQRSDANSSPEATSLPLPSKLTAQGANQELVDDQSDQSP
eukprot:s840_g12.t1